MQIIFGMNSVMGAITGLIFTRHWLGALVGFVVGAYSDSMQKQRRSGSYQSQRGRNSFDRGFAGQSQQMMQQQFSKSLLTLSAVVMKADGKVLKSELEFVKQFLVQQFGRQNAPDYLSQLKILLNSPINVQESCSKIRQILPPQQRSMILQYLFGIAQSDGHVSNQELHAIENIARMLGITEYEFSQLKAMFWKDASSAYKSLGITKEATEQEIKKAYRKMARAHHPDKVASLGESYQTAAKEKFQKIQEAYETIKKERGF